jgi:hypothetical protein
VGFLGSVGQRGTICLGLVTESVADEIVREVGFGWEMLRILKIGGILVQE